MVIRNPDQSGQRQGSSAVELAVMMPLLGMLLVGMLELGRGVMVKWALTDAARKGCRTAILPGQTDAQTRMDVTNILTDNFSAAAVANATIVIRQASGPANDQPWASANPAWNTSSPGFDLVVAANRGDAIAVKVSIKVADTGWIYGWFLPASGIESEMVVMLKQG
jgi:Flp pilus assembly protein TadG